MKKLFITVIALAAAVTAFAGRPTGLNLGGGYAMMFNNRVIDSIQSSETNVTDVGAFAEVGYDLNFGKLSAVYFGARYRIGFNAQYEDAYVSQAGIERREHLDIPVMYKIAFDVSPTTKIFLQAGPTVNFWLSNNYTYVAASGSQSGTYHKNLFEITDYNRVNLSLGGAAGVHFNHIKIYAAFDAGLFNLYKNTSSVKATANCLRIGAAYVF